VTLQMRRPLQQLLPLQVLLLPLVAEAGAIAAPTPKMSTKAASRMRMVVAPSEIFPQRQVVYAIGPLVKAALACRFGRMAA